MMTEKGRWVIGDIHGCSKTLTGLIKQIRTSGFKDDPLTFVGDLIDRGSNSASIVQYVIDNKIDCCMGNHEIFMQMFLDESVKFYDADRWKVVGGDKTLESYDYDLTRMQEHFDYIQQHCKLFFYYEIDGHKPLVVSHSAVGNVWKGPELLHYDKEDTHTILWTKYRSADTEMFSGIDMDKASENNIFNIFGHTSESEVYKNEYMANIDTGAVYGRQLTAMHYPSMTLLQQKNID